MKKRTVKFNRSFVGHGGDIKTGTQTGVVIAEKAGTFGGTLLVKNGEGYFLVAENYTKGHCNQGYILSPENTNRAQNAFAGGDSDDIFYLMEELRW